jgi:co-chaperonin GroES (HSP10)
MAITPCGHRIIVRPDSIPERQGTLYLPTTTREREKYAQTFGVIVAIGPTAWKAFDSGEPWAKVGDHISFAKYGGYLVEDPETKEHFRILNDEDCVSVITGTYKPVEEVA